MKDTKEKITFSFDYSYNGLLLSYLKVTITDILNHFWFKLSITLYGSYNQSYLHKYQFIINLAFIIEPAFIIKSPFIIKSSFIITSPSVKTTFQTEKIYPKQKIGRLFSHINRYVNVA